MSSSGRRANLRGQMLEEAVIKLLSPEHEQVTAQRFFAMRLLDQPIYAKQVPVGTDIYGKRRRIDFMVFSPQRWPGSLAIQCKWQASRGSVEEKYPFEVLSIKHNSIDAVIVLDGGGYTDGAKAWLQTQVNDPDNRLRGVFDLGEFTRYISQRQA